MNISNQVEHGIIKAVFKIGMAATAGLLIANTAPKIINAGEKTPAHLRNRFIPNLVADGILLPTKPRHTKGQTYMTNPKLDK